MNTKQIMATISAIILLTIGFLVGQPNYSVWASGMAGQAELAQASYNRQIAVNEAKAKEEAAVLLAKAAVEQAKGIAEANRIIGNSLRNNREYLNYLYITHLAEGDSRETIYVPTEAGIPILESNRLHPSNRTPSSR